MPPIAPAAVTNMMWMKDIGTTMYPGGCGGGEYGGIGGQGGGGRIGGGGGGDGGDSDEEVPEPTSASAISQK